MRSSSISGFILTVAIVISGITAMVGYGLVSVENEMENPEVAQEIREGIESKSLLDIFLGTTPHRNDPEPSFDDEIIIPATRLGDHLFVQAELNDYQEVLLLVDTGASDIAISSDMAYELGLMESESRVQKYNTSNGASRRFVTKLDSISVGEAVRHNVGVSFSNANTGHGDGLLGMSFLKHYYVDVDLEREELRLRPRRS